MVVVVSSLNDKEVDLTTAGTPYTTSISNFGAFIEMKLPRNEHDGTIILVIIIVVEIVAHDVAIVENEVPTEP